MKRLIAFLISCWLLLACNDTATTKPEVDTHSSTSVSATERARQIDKAKNNRTLLPGKWQVIESMNGDGAMTKTDGKDLDFDIIRFTSTDSFAVYQKRKILDSGTYEWMAEDRELVTTSTDETIHRMLVKNISTQYLKLKYNGSFMTFKKVN